MSHSTGTPTKAQAARMAAIKRMQCKACCQESMPQPFPTEVHHLVDKGTRKHSGGHDSTIPLCAWHHRGEITYPLTGREMKELHGPSFALHKRSFIAQYGTERELLAQTNADLESRAAA